MDEKQAKNISVFLTVIVIAQTPLTPPPPNPNLLTTSLSSFLTLSYSPEGCADHPDKVKHPVGVSNGRLAHFLKFELAGSGVGTIILAHFKFEEKCTKWPILSLASCYTRPDHSAE
jgi:hypothetical protein